MKSTNNSLLDARFNTGLSLTEVARRLGIRRMDRLGIYERGQRLPTLKNAITLEILYQQPIAALFPEVYQEIREQLRRNLRKDRHGKAT